MPPSTLSTDEPRSSMLSALDSDGRGHSSESVPFSSLTLLTHMQPHPFTLLPDHAHRSDDTAESAALSSAGSALTLLPPLLEPGTDDRTLLPLSVLRLAPVGAASAALDTEFDTANKSSLFGALTHVPVSAESTSLDIFFSMPTLDDLPDAMDDAAIREAMSRSDATMTMGTAGTSAGADAGMFGLGLGGAMGGMDAFGGGGGTGEGGFGGFGMGSLLPPLPSMGGAADEDASLLKAVVPFDERRSLLARTQRNPMAHAQQQLQQQQQQQLQLTAAAAGESSTALVAPASSSSSALYTTPSDVDDESVSSGANLMGVGWRSALDAAEDDAVPAGWSDRFALPALLPGGLDETRRAQHAAKEAAARREAQREREHIERIWTIMQSLQDPASRLRIEEATAAAAEEAARDAAKRRVPRAHPSSVAFPSHALPALARTPTFSQASWDSPALHRLIGEYDRLGSALPLRHLSPGSSSLEAFHQILHAVGPASWTSAELVVEEASIVRQLLQVLQAVSATEHFQWNTTLRRYQPRVRFLRLGLCTPRALQLLLSPLLRLAAQVKLLWEFVRLFSAHEQRPLASSPADDLEDPPLQFDPGSVLHAFAAGVEEALQQYTIAILQLPSTVRRRRRGELDGPAAEDEEVPLTLLELSAHLALLSARMQFLTDLCETPRVIDDPASFPRGALLLDRLYELCLESSFDVAPAAASSALASSPSPSVLLVRGLFLRSLRAYMSLLLVWIHRGELRDPFREFLIEWREAETSAGKDQQGRRKIVLVPHRRADKHLPGFLAHLEADVVAMGHTVQLLQLYTPRKEDAVAAPAVDPDAAAKRHRARKSSMQLAEDDALALRTRKLQAQSDYALSLRAQIAEKDAALAKLAAQARAEDAKNSTPDPAAQAIIAAERTRLLAALDAARSPHSITGGGNPRLDWRSMREQLSPMRAEKMLKIEEEQIAAMKQLMTGGKSADIATGAVAGAAGAGENRLASTSKPDEELKPQRLDMNIHADEEKRNGVAAAPSALTAPIAVLPSASSSSSIVDSADSARPPLLLLPSPPADEAPIEVLVSPSAASAVASSALAIMPSASPVEDVQLAARAAVVPLPPLAADGSDGEEEEEDAYVFPGGSILSRNEDPLPYGSAQADAAAAASLFGPSSPEDEAAFSSMMLSPDAALRALDSLAEQLASASPAPLSVLVESTLVPSLLLPASILSARGLHHFYTVHHLDSHLHALRRYMLMQAGDMMDDFCAQLWKSQARQAGAGGLSDASLSAAHAFEILESCSKAHAPATSMKAQALHALAMKHLSFRLDPAAAEGAKVEGELKTLRSLQLRYTVSYPLSLLLPAHTLSDYSSVWSFLLQMQRVHEDLSWMWSHLQQNESRVCKHERALFELQRAIQRRRRDGHDEPLDSPGAATLASDLAALPLLRSRLRTLHAARSEMHHLVLVLRGYMLGEVLEGGWTRLQAQLRAAAHWGEVRDRHQSYVSHIVRACFRTPTPTPEAAASAAAAAGGGSERPSTAASAAAHSTSLISSALDKLLASVLEFKARLAEVSLDQPLGSAAWQGLLGCRDRFRAYMQFLYSLLTHQASADLQSTKHSSHHLTAKQLLARLDFNEFYLQKAAAEAK